MSSIKEGWQTQDQTSANTKELKFDLIVTRVESRRC